MIETFNQFRRRIIDEVAAEYGISKAEAEESIGNRAFSEWRDASLASLLDGKIPSQQWCNIAREADPYWWDRRVLHDHPDLFDRLSRAGLSLYWTKAERDQKARELP